MTSQQADFQWAEETLTVLVLFFSNLVEENIKSYRELSLRKGGGRGGHRSLPATGSLLG